MKFVSVVIPCHNEEAGIMKTHVRVREVFERSNLHSELIFVNDGSTDQTGEILDNLPNSEKTNVVILHFSKNFGHSAAVLAGIKISQGSVVAIIDADLQDPPELLPEMIAKLDSGYDIVYGKRMQRKSETWMKRSTAWLFYRILRFLTDVDIPADTGDFRVMTREVADVIRDQIHEQDPFLRGLVAWVGFRQIPFEYIREPRIDGETKYTFKKMLRFALTGILGFSNAPLYLAAYASLFFFALSLFSVFYLIYLKYNAFTVPGWVSMMVLFSIFGAVQFLFLGIAGVYIARINKQVTGRPLFIVKKKSS
jgi:glycosyltransferase involved in cell wall biosynthesis